MNASVSPILNPSHSPTTGSHGHSHSAAVDLPLMPAGVQVVTLENGLVVIVQEDHSAPVVSVQAWAKTGSINEGKWLGAGMSHMLEHMLFKGTQRRLPGNIDQEVQDAGGNMNAYTSFDRTVYWISVPREGATIAIDILCDIMQNATLPADELAKEMQVVLREMDMNQDDPSRRASRRLFETAYVRSPYRNTVIGYPDIFNELRRDDLLAYYKEKYAPNNSFIVAVGDFKASEVLEQVREAYKTAKARPFPPEVLPGEPIQSAARETIEEAPVELGHVHIAWHIPELRHADVPALDTLATLLGNGHSSRMYQEIREKKGVVHSIDAWTYSPGNPGLFGVSAVIDGDQYQPAHDAILKEIDRLKTELISPAELGKALKQFTAATLSSRKTMQGQAQDLGSSWMAANDLNFSARYLAAVRALHPDDLQRVARKYLVSTNRTSYALMPKGTLAAQVHVVEASGENPIHEHKLANGLRVLVKSSHRLPFIDCRLVFQGGVLSEPIADNGVNLMMAKLLMKGTETMSAEELMSTIESLGGNLDSYSANNSFGLNMEVMQGDFDTGMRLMSEVVLRPAFPETALEREREVQLAAIRSQKDHLLQSASRGMRRLIFGSQGYGLDSVGTEETVQAITRQKVQDFHTKMMIPQNAVLAIFGDVTEAEAVACAERYLGAWTGGKQLGLNPGPAPVHTAGMRASEIVDKKQGVIVIGFPGVSIFDKDRYALDLLQEALSDLGSRLFVRIRENLGLAYYVGAQQMAGLSSGYFAFYAGTMPEKLELVETEILKEVANLRTDGLTAEELTRAKAKLVGQRKISRQDLGSYATAAALDELYGLGYANTDLEHAHYEAVTLEDMLHVTRKHLKPDYCAVSVVHPKLG